MGDDGGLLILLFSFLLLFHFSFSFLSPHLLWFFSFFFFLLFLSTPTLLISYSPHHPSTFPKKQKRRPEKPFLVEKERAHKEVYKKNKSGVEEKKKTQGMRRDSAHLYGVFNISVVLCHFFSIIFFSTANISSPHKVALE